MRQRPPIFFRPAPRDRLSNGTGVATASRRWSLAWPGYRLSFGGRVSANTWMGSRGFAFRFHQTGMRPAARIQSEAELAFAGLDQLEVAGERPLTWLRMISSGSIARAGACPPSSRRRRVVRPGCHLNDVDRHQSAMEVRPREAYRHGDARKGLDMQAGTRVPSRDAEMRSSTARASSCSYGQRLAHQRGDSARTGGNWDA